MAAVGGVAYMGAKAATNKAMAAQGAQAPAEAAPATAPGGDDTIARLQQLATLHDAGSLTDEEFAAAKARVLS
jgi:hypothetical protein